MKIIKILLGLIVSSVSFSGFADPYTNELSLNWGYIDVSGVTNGSGSILSFDYNHYYSDISTESGPLAEAAFLSKSSSINVAFNKTKIDLKEVLIKDFNFGINYMANDEIMIIANLNFVDEEESRIDETFFNNVRDQLMLNIVTIGGGYYFDSSSLITMTYTSINSDPNFWFVTPPPILSSIVSVYGKKIISFADQRALNIEAGISSAEFDSNEADSYINYEFVADYYFTNQFSIGVGFVGTEEEQVDNTTFFNIGYFFREGYSLVFDYSEAGSASSMLLTFSSRY